MLQLGLKIICAMVGLNDSFGNSLRIVAATILNQLKQTITECDQIERYMFHKKFSIAHTLFMT